MFVSCNVMLQDFFIIFSFFVMKASLLRIKDKERKNNTQATKNKERGDDNDYGKEKCYAER